MLKILSTSGELPANSKQNWVLNDAVAGLVLLRGATLNPQKRVAPLPEVSRSSNMLEKTIRFLLEPHVSREQLCVQLERIKIIIFKISFEPFITWNFNNLYPDIWEIPKTSTELQF